MYIYIYIYIYIFSRTLGFPSFSTNVVRRIRRGSEAEGVPGCTPTRVKDVSILYFNFIHL